MLLFHKQTYVLEGLKALRAAAHVYLDRYDLMNLEILPC